MAPPLYLQQTTETGQFTLWWFLLLVAVGFLWIIVYLVSRIGPGGPWMRH